MKELESVSRVDLVWKVYVADSLEKSAMEKERLWCFFYDWEGFLRVDQNKVELFKFLANKVTTMTK